MYEYNVDRINSAISARKRIRKACKAIVLQYAPVPLPEIVLKRICTRRKLYNFLDALELNHTCIQAIFWSHNLAVPRDRSLKPSAIQEEQKPSWLDGGALPSESDNNDIFF